MRPMGNAPMTTGWKPVILLLNYGRLIAVGRIERPHGAHEAPVLNHYTIPHSF